MSEEKKHPSRRYFRIPENFAELTDEEIENFADHIYMQMGKSQEQTHDPEDDCKGPSLIPDSNCMCEPCVRNRAW